MARRSKIDERLGLLETLRRRLALVRLFLAVESIWRSLWPVALAIGVYAAAGLLGVFDTLPLALHIIAFLGLLGLCVALLVRRRGRLRWPSEAEARRRIEADWGVVHRPLDALFDAPATAAGGATLWRRHRERMAAAAKRLRPRWPRLSLTAEDPRALRSLVALLLLVGMLVAGSDAGRRLAAAFSPALSGPAADVRVDAWITPPDYTQKSPIMLQSAENGPIGADEAESDLKTPAVVPAGSRLTAVVHGLETPPLLRRGDAETAFSAIGPREHRLESDLADAASLELVHEGRILARWPVSWLPDEPPSVGFAKEPGKSRRHALRIDYTLFDDYGVESVKMQLTPLSLEGEPVRIELRGAETRGEPVERTSYKDLAAHRYAGADMQAVLIARDAAGQTGRSDPHRLTLPMREFSHPVARKLAAIRLKLLRHPEQTAQAGTEIDTVSREPAAFDHDLMVFAALRSAYHRLQSDRSGKAVDEVAEILWETALRLEDGRLSLATRSLRDALDKFAEAMEAESGSLAEAAEALERELQNFLAQMAAQQAELAPRQQQMLEGGQAKVVGSDMLQRMIQRMRELAAAGETEAAMRMLRQLREIAENATAGGMSEEEYRRMMAASRAARQLERLERDQRELLNRTGRQTLLNRLRQRRGEPRQGFDGLEQEQGALRQGLSGLGETLSEGGMPLPEQLGEAGEAMEDAGRALGQRSGPDAVRNQAEAVRRMNEAGERLRQSLEQAMAQMPGSNGLDPLGRPRPGLNARDFEIPDEMSVKDAERILKELRRRMSDPAIGEEERAYIRRLLRRF